MPSDIPLSLSGASVALIGLGRMGGAMAHRLLDAGVTLSVYNRTAAKADPFVERGATRLDSLAEAAACDLVFTMVTDDAALDALAGPGGLFDQGAPAVWIDGSTVAAATAERAGAAAHAAGTAYVSAPVSGNPTVVAAGNAIFAISGDEAALDITEEFLRCIGRAVMRVGNAAEANVVKLCVNALLAVTMQSVAEIAVLADRAGVSRAGLMEFLNESAVGSPFTKYKTANVVELTFEPTFTPVGQRKDVRLALDLARELEVPMPVLNTTEVAFSRLVSGGLGDDRDFAALILEVARDAGVELKPEKLRPSR
ncbi:MAG TPA: NAD(P)-dependent oxidoreductase [Pseudolysinimonas sp.]|nr:NAD(P)-dependent oxidoreductase [Pseudolysinimonas sp.]